jgi:cellulose synthase/poly-beta-1,6-N-acetylglucosamine synthase-like glycosyltransferase
MLPTFTAIVAAWNEGSNLNRHILSFKSLERSDCELVISAGGTDGSYAIANSFAGPKIKVLKQLPGEGKQRALQNCLESASHELLYFTDADCDFDARAISYIFDPLLSQTTRVSTGGCRPRPQQIGNYFVQYQACKDVSVYDRPKEPGGLLGRNFAITRTALDSVNAFLPEVSTGTDYHLAMMLRSAGIPVTYVKESRVPTVYPVAYRDYLSHARRWIKNPVVWEPITNLPGFGVSLSLAVSLLSGPLFLFTRKRVYGQVWALLMGITFARRILLLGCGRSQGVALNVGLFARLPIFVALEQIAVIEAACEIMTPRGRRRW